MIYAYRLEEETGTRDWYDPCVLASALGWAEYVVGWSKLDPETEACDDFLGKLRVSVAGAVALVQKAPDRLGDLLELLIRADIHELT